MSDGRGATGGPDQLAAARRRFAAMVAHELRGPLTAAVGHAELLVMLTNGAATDPTVAGMAREIHTAVEAVSAVIDDVLLATVGPDQLELRPVYLAEALAEGLPDDPHLATLAAPLRAAPRVRGDAPLVARILAELVRNGRAPSGGREQPRLSARLLGADVLLEAADSGPPILPEERTAALDRLDREPAGLRSRRNPALGLSVARALAEAMGGRLEIDDAPGDGCRLRLRLPAA
ncbi:MAG TPA: HAMP domain-containing sensor histidine kinase [Candidatus Dormibacteraeota bacterium]